MIGGRELSRPAIMVNSKFKDFIIIKLKVAPDTNKG